MVVLKVIFDNDIRRVTLPKPLSSFSDLSNLVKSLYGNELPDRVILKYRDDEGDLISITTDLELMEAFSQSKDMLRVFVIKDSTSLPQEKKIPSGDFSVTALEKAIVNNPLIRSLLQNLDLEVTVEERQKNDNSKSCTEILSIPLGKTAEENEESRHPARCDNCKIAPITGIRYKCNECPDFDLCEKCHENKDKIHTPGHTYAKIRRSFCPPSSPSTAVPSPSPPSSAVSAPSAPAVSATSSSSTQSDKTIETEKDRNTLLDSDTNPDIVVHPATCDGCHERIRGIRYKCVQCPDYDLCQSCRDKSIHSEHAFRSVFKPIMYKSSPSSLKLSTSSSAPSSPLPPRSAPIPIPIPASSSPAPVSTPAPIPVPVVSAPTPSQVAPVPVSVPIPVAVPAPTPLTIPIPKEAPLPSIVPLVPLTVKPVETLPASPLRIVDPTPTESVSKSSPKPPVPVKEVTLTPYEMKLNQLLEMGFDNAAKNKKLLHKYSGDLQLVVRDLLQDH